MGVYLRACVRACSVGACVQMCDAVCMCVCVCMHTRAHVCQFWCMCVRVHMHVRISAYQRMSTFVCASVSSCTHFRACMPTCLRASVHGRALMCVCRLWCGGGKQRAAVNEKTTRESRPSRCLPCVRLPRSCSSDWVMGQARASLVTVSDFTD